MAGLIFRTLKLEMQVSLQASLQASLQTVNDE